LVVFGADWADLSSDSEYDEPNQEVCLTEKDILQSTQIRECRPVYQRAVESFERKVPAQGLFRDLDVCSVSELERGESSGLPLKAIEAHMGTQTHPTKSKAGFTPKVWFTQTPRETKGASDGSSKAKANGQTQGHKKRGTKSKLVWRRKPNQTPQEKAPEAVPNPIIKGELDDASREEPLSEFNFEDSDPSFLKMAKGDDSICFGNSSLSYEQEPILKHSQSLSHEADSTMDFTYKDDSILMAKTAFCQFQKASDCSDNNFSTTYESFGQSDKLPPCLSQEQEYPKASLEMLLGDESTAAKDEENKKKKKKKKKKAKGGPSLPRFAQGNPFASLV
jgi:hypothetical protein